MASDFSSGADGAAASHLPSERKPVGGEAWESGADDFSFGSLDVVFDAAKLDGGLIRPVENVASAGISIAGLADRSHVHENLPVWRHRHDVFPCPLSDLPAWAFLPPKHRLVGVSTEGEI